MGIIILTSMVMEAVRRPKYAIESEHQGTLTQSHSTISRILKQNRRSRFLVLIFHQSFEVNINLITKKEISYCALLSSIRKSLFVATALPAGGDELGIFRLLN